MDRPRSSPPTRAMREFLDPPLRRSHYWERRTLAEAIRELGPRIRRGRILDVGCGIQPYRSLIERPGDRYIGLDYPVTMEKSYREATAAAVFADCTRLPIRSGSCDSAVSTQVLEHVPHPAQMVRELARILKPGGSLLLSAPMTWPLHEEPFDFFRYTRHGIKQLLSDAGLALVECRDRGSSVTTLVQMLLDTALDGRLDSRAGRWIGAVLSIALNGTGRLLEGAGSPRLRLGCVALARKPSA